MPKVKSQAKTAAPAKKKAAKPAPIKTKAQPKKPPAKKAPAPKNDAPTKSTQQSKKKLVGDFNDKAYLQVILDLAKQSDNWAQVVSSINEGYVTRLGKAFGANNFKRDFGRRMSNKNPELRILAKEIFAEIE